MLTSSLSMWQKAQLNLQQIWRIIYSAAIGFWEDDCYTKASTLTFYTLQSLIPFLAAALAVAKGFGFDEYLERVLTTTFAEQKEILNYAIQIALSLLKFISNDEIVGIGVLLLLWTNVNLVGYIELTLSTIWHIKTSRTIFQKIKDFSFALLIFPLIFTASSSFTIYLKAQISHLPYFSSLGQLTSHEVKFIFPWLLSCFMFGALYFLTPSTGQLRVLPRLIAGVVAGSAFQLWQVIFINLQLYIFSYNVVYGAFALLPLFFIWLQFSWIIALGGAEIAAHIERSQLGLQDKEGTGFIQINRETLALLIVKECLTAFYDGRAPITLINLSNRLKIDQDALVDLVAALEAKEILISFYNKDNQICYHPFYDPTRLSIMSVCDAIQYKDDKAFVVANSAVVQAIEQSLDHLYQDSQKSSGNLSLSKFFTKLQQACSSSSLLSSSSLSSSEENSISSTQS